MRRILIVCLATILLCSILGAQQPLTNNSVIKMVKAGLSQDVILNLINTQPSNFNLGVDQLIALKKAGVGDSLIAAMVKRTSGGAPAAAPATTTPAVSSARPIVPEIGVYYKKDGKWLDVLPEVVNWKTGGVFKSIASAGIINGDVNGRLDRPHSRTRLATPVEFLIYAPEGTAITEYQLIKLREKKKGREFRTVTGGVLHTSGGARRDLVSFKSEKIAPRNYTVRLTNLDPGEYGFLPPGLIGSQGASAQLGKMYTFMIIE